MARFVVCPPLRCCKVLGDQLHLTCGARATRETFNPLTQRNEFRCDAHVERGHWPIAEPVIFRRVSFVAEVLFAGTSWHPGPAKLEALAQLEAAVAAAGGLLGLNEATCVTGSYGSPAREERANASEARGQLAGVRH